MKILWIEDETFKKCFFFNEALNIQCYDDKDLSLLKDHGFDIYHSLKEIVDEFDFANLNESILNFFDKYDLIFCDVNLVQGERKNPLPPETKKQLSKGGYTIKYDSPEENKNNEGVDVWSLGNNAHDDESSSRRNRKHYHDKFFFLSAYPETISVIKDVAKRVYHGENGMDVWIRKHFIPSKSKILNFSPEFSTDVSKYKIDGIAWKQIGSTKENPDFATEKNEDGDGNSIQYLAATSPDGKYRITCPQIQGWELVEGEHFRLKREEDPEAIETMKKIKTIFEQCEIVKLEHNYKLFRLIETFKDDAFFKDYFTTYEKIVAGDFDIDDTQMNRFLDPLRGICSSLQEEMLLDLIIPNQTDVATFNTKLDQIGNQITVSKKSPGQFDFEVVKKNAKINYKENQQKTNKETSNIAMIFLPPYVYRSVEFAYRMLCIYFHHANDNPQTAPNCEKRFKIGLKHSYLFLVFTDCIRIVLAFLKRLKTNKQLAQGIWDHWIPPNCYNSGYSNNTTQSSAPSGNSNACPNVTTAAPCATGNQEQIPMSQDACSTKFVGAQTSSATTTPCASMLGKKRNRKHRQKHKPAAPEAST
ncbi:MAG: hypothetical protein J5654_12960 [Victivallales bacterium]|nr:hypothetical protein [Victivallales bacterium]